MASRQVVSRRHFLALAAGAGAAAGLAACGGSSAPAAPAIGGGSGGASTPTGATSAPAAAPTAASASTSSGAATTAPGAAAGSLNASTKVYVLQDKTFADIGFQKATDLYNQARPTAPQIVIETIPDGWDTKVLAQIKDKSLRWNAHGYVIFSEQYKHVKAGIFTPLDDLLKSSTIPWAHTQKDQYFTPRVYEAMLLDGKQYYLPMKINVHLAGYRQDYLQAAGYDTLPNTWDEIDKMLPKMKAALAKDQVIPFSIQDELWRSIGTTFATFIEKPLDEQGVFKIESSEWLDMLTMFQKWTNTGLARYDANADAIDAWQKGKFGMSVGSHSWVRLGRQVWADKVKGANPPQANASAPARTWAHIDGVGVFNNAPYAQQGLDWCLATTGPEGAPAEAWWRGALTFSGSPVHQSWIDKIVTPNKDTPEVGEVLKLLPNSQIVTIAQTNGFNLCQLLMPPYLGRIFKGEITPKDAMTKLRADINAELAKQKA